MGNAFTDLRRRAALFFPDASNIEPGWLQKVVALDSELLKGVQKSRQASRLVRRAVSEHYQLVVPQRESLQREQLWLLLDHSQQRDLAKKLGTQVCRHNIRTTVTREAVAQLRDYLGEEDYLQTLRSAADSSGFAVAGVQREAFDQAVAQQHIGRYVTAHGVALLEQTLDTDDPFFALRMRFAFSPACWNMRPRGLTADMEQLRPFIIRLTEAY